MYAENDSDNDSDFEPIGNTKADFSDFEQTSKPPVFLYDLILAF